MKRFTLFIIILSIYAGISFSQNPLRERLKKDKNSYAYSNKRIINNESDYQINSIVENSVWSRVIYRHIDLTKPANAPLYYPVTPTDNKMNLFTVIFRMLQNGEIQAYEYIDGREVFTAEYEISFADFIEKFDIYNTTQNESLEINASDIPSDEITGYYLKEIYFVDTPTSSFSVQPIAICPILEQTDDYGVTLRYPLFWVPYHQIEKFIQFMPIMMSSKNNSLRGSIDDFFKMRRYEGEIYKAGNPANIPITQSASTEEIKKEQEKIEEEIKMFEKMYSSKPNEGAVYNDNINNKTQRKNNRNRKYTTTNRQSSTTNSMRDRRY